MNPTMKRNNRKILTFLSIFLILTAMFTGCRRSDPSLSPDPNTESSDSSTPFFSTPFSANPETSPQAESDFSEVFPPSDVSPTPDPTPTPSKEPDHDFDLQPTGSFVSLKTASDLSRGNLLLVNAQNPYASSLAESLKIIRVERKSSVNVSLFMHQVTEETLNALDEMEKALEKETGTSKTLLVTAAWRNEEDQEVLLEKNKDVPGYKGEPLNASEHYTGLCLDLKFWDGQGTYSVGVAGATAESRWLLENAARFGFVVRYPAGKEDYTGYPEEVGHFRYVGKAHAAYMKNNDMCLEQYIEFLKDFGPNNRLVITDEDGYSWSIYYVKANDAGETELVLPKGVVYETSGNNRDGFIVSVKSVWEGNLTEQQDKVPVTGVTLEKTEFNLQTGANIQLSYTVLPSNADNRKVTFSSSDPSVLTVSNDGTVTAIAPGHATVTVKTQDGGHTASAAFTVVAPASSTVIWIDAGHGCSNSAGIPDVGAGEGSPFYKVSGGFYEADLNMQIAAQVKELFLKAGYTVMMTRDGYRAEYVTVHNRAEEANAAMADVFVSIHANSSENSSTRGAYVYYNDNRADRETCRTLAQSVANSIHMNQCSARNVSALTADYAVLVDTEMPSILVETCFLTNSEDAQQAITEKWCTAMAASIFEGIAAIYSAR